jgi:hypothetical protein
LDHLPDGAPYGLVEVDMTPLVSDSVYKEFEKQLGYRERQRKRKREKEDQYAGKVERLQDEKFEMIKKQAINSVNTAAHWLVPGVVRNYEPRASHDTLRSGESQEEEARQGEAEEYSLHNQHFRLNLDQ